jgi:hypothetical protein
VSQSGFRQLRVAVAVGARLLLSNRNVEPLDDAAGADCVLSITLMGERRLHFQAQPDQTWFAAYTLGEIELGRHPNVD